jgi:sulfate adenylyltransferase subunit 1
VQIHRDRNLSDFRFPVQFVNRPNLDFRGFCGTIASGLVKTGDAVTVLPSGKASRIKSIIIAGENAREAFAGQAVTLTLQDEVDISRGDMIVHSGADVEVSTGLRAQLIWMSESELQPGREYLFKFASKLTPGSVRAIKYKVNVNTQEHSPAATLGLNDIAVIEISLNNPVTIDPYIKNRVTGAFIMIDRLSNVTVAGGMVIETTKGTFQAAGKDSLRQKLQALLQQSLTDAELATALRKLLGGGASARMGKSEIGKRKTGTVKKTTAKSVRGKTKTKRR